MTSISAFATAYHEAADRAKGYIWPVFLSYDDEDRAYAMLGHESRSLAELWMWEGCSAEQIDEVRAAWGGWLPESFEAYLQVMGIKSQHVNIGVNCNYPAVLEAKDAYEEWVWEVRSLDLEWYGNGERFAVPEQACHLGRRGYIFQFIADRNSDPIVYRLMAGGDSESGVAALDQTFSELVVGGIDGACAFTERLLESSVRRRKARGEL